MSLACRSRTNAIAAVFAVSALVLTIGSTIGACTSATTTPAYAPITGIVIQASSLVAGFGCGVGASQVFRYGAVLTDAPPDASADANADAGTPTSAVVLTNLFDCFTDGVFENLPTTSGSAFDIAIYAYSPAAYARAGLPSSLGCAPGEPSDAASCLGSSQSLTGAQKTDATWTAECSATEVAGVPVVAVCGPLEARPSSARLGIDGGDASADGAMSPGDGATGPSPESSTETPTDSSTGDAIDEMPLPSDAAPDGSD